MEDGYARVVLLHASAIGIPKFEKLEFRDAKHLKKHFEDCAKIRDHGERRIYIMEGLAADFVAAFGDHFWMDPTFWLRQERSCPWSNDFTPVSDALPQPSLIDPDSSFHVQYCELREFNKALESLPCFCKRTRRHVGMTAPRKYKPNPGSEAVSKAESGEMSECKDEGKDIRTGEFKGNTTTAFLRRKASWWCQEHTTASGEKGKDSTAGKGWDVVILCDPPLRDMTGYPREWVWNSKMGDFELQRIKDVTKLKNKPFQGGYVDFVPPQRLAYRQLPPKDKPRHPHDSMLTDLVYYYMNNADLLKVKEWESPSKSAVFLKKIVAAHYLQLADYIKVMLPSLELKMQTGWVEEQEQWKALGTISRRCGNFGDDIEDALVSLGYPLEIPKHERRVGDPLGDRWKDCRIDYQYAYHRLSVLKRRADTLMTSMTGLASIAGNKQNLEEAKRVKRLNLLALLFIPLAYTSSLFSMQDQYAPNQPLFWVYWVCAIGVVMFTSVVMWVLDQALNDAAEWTLDSFKSFPKWSKEQGAKGTHLFGSPK
ncbi:hypothetical protein E8E13_004473 [Curvularia kusanoi]|uniref:Uncharacterized protein n=1 Tax=Curvularia kusanoi TaxID=90978 RepID=A0A9P4TDB5_CURKU|nr:hypothetical protein E8E13_004473 [Curvularia kusanoi]